MENLTALLEDVLKPISSTNPVGDRIDVNEDFDFVTIKTEIDKMSLITGGVDQEKLAEQTQAITGTQGTVSVKSSVNETGANYKVIIECSRNILRDKSKNLLVLAYMNVGLIQEYGIEGLTIGLQAFQGFNEQFWADCYPEKKKMRLRGAALTFLLPKIQTYLERYNKKEDAAVYEAALEALSKVSGFWMREMAEHAPAMGEVRSRLDKLKKQASAAPTPPPPPPPPEPSPQVEQTTVPEPVQAPLASSAALPTFSVSLGAMGSMEDAIQAAVSLASGLRAIDRTSPIAYRVLRTTMWGSIDGEPANGFIPAPEAYRLNYYLNELANQGVETVIEEVEGAFQEFPFPMLLDLQRILVQALEKAGSTYSKVKDAVMLETALLLKRIPNFPNLMFNDGTPFASSATQVWIEDEVLPVLASGGGSGANLMITAGEEDAALVAAYEEAQQVMDNHDPATAIAKLMAGMESDVSGRARFRRRLLVAMFCMKVGHMRVALPLLEELDLTCRSLELARWEPALALDVWSNLHKCYRLLQNEADEAFVEVLQKQQDDIFNLMCKTDVRYALAALGERPKPIRSAKISEEN